MNDGRTIKEETEKLMNDDGSLPRRDPFKKDETPFSSSKYNALDKAWRKLIKFDILPKQEQDLWNKKLFDIEGSNINLDALHAFIKGNFSEKDCKKIYIKADNFKDIADKNKEKRQKEETREFHKKCNIILNIDNYMENAEEFWHQNPYFYDDEAKIFWLWNKELFKYEMISEPKLMVLFDDILGFRGQTVSSTTKNNHLEAFKRFGLKKKPMDAPVKWVQFKDKAFSIKSGKIYEVKPNYFFTNPIPWEIGQISDTPFLDKLFKDWVGEKELPDLYEFIAYCCYRDYPIQLLFCLHGHGRNGKSTFIKIVDKFLGKENTCTTDLDMIAGMHKSRFETVRLYKKLACFMGETNFNILENSSILKKLVGGDKIGFEVKGGGLFDDFNYAKIIIASNSLPSSEDTSEGFYRRWHIIDFPNEFPEGKDISLNVPEAEFNNLAKKITEILPKLLEKGSFSNQGSIEQRKEKYILASNPLPFFIDYFCYQNPIKYVRYSKLYLTYTTFLKVNKRRIVSKKEFTKILNAESLETRKTSHDGEIDYYVEGLEIKPDFLDFPDFHKFQISHISEKTSKKFLEIEENKEKQEIEQILTAQPIKEELVE